MYIYRKKHATFLTSCVRECCKVSLLISRCIESSYRYYKIFLINYVYTILFLFLQVSKMQYRPLSFPLSSDSFIYRFLLRVFTNFIHVVNFALRNPAYLQRINYNVSTVAVPNLYAPSTVLLSFVFRAVVPSYSNGLEAGNTRNKVLRLHR